MSKFQPGDSVYLIYSHDSKAFKEVVLAVRHRRWWQWADRYLITNSPFNPKLVRETKLLPCVVPGKKGEQS